MWHLWMTGVTLNGCQVNESAIKDVSGERKMEWWFDVQSWVLWQALCFLCFFWFCRWFWEGADGGGLWTWWHDYQVLMLLWIVVSFVCFWQVGWQERFWLWCGWIKWVAEDGLEQNAQGSVGFVLRSFFFLLCRCTFSSLSFLNCSVQNVHWIQNLLFPMCSYIKLGQELVLLHEIKWALTWRWWFVEREQIAMFLGNGLDFQFVIQAKVGER